jgi:hypothetical protein
MRCASARRADRESLGHQSARAFRGHADHGGDTAERFERKPLDRLLIGNDVVVAGGQQAIDAPDPERMFEGDNFTSGADGHERIAFRETPCAGASQGSMRSLSPNSHRFLAAHREQAAARLFLRALAAPDAKREFNPIEK